MKKLIMLLLLTVFFLAGQRVALADTVNMIDGTTLTGHIVKVTSCLVNMKTRDGLRKFTRIQVLNNRDFVEVGLTKSTSRTIVGKVFLATPFTVELHTPQGIVKVNRFMVRNIVLGHVTKPDEQLELQLPEQVEKMKGS